MFNYNKLILSQNLFYNTIIITLSESLNAFKTLIVEKIKEVLKSLMNYLTYVYDNLKYKKMLNGYLELTNKDRSICSKCKITNSLNVIIISRMSPRGKRHHKVKIESESPKKGIILSKIDNNLAESKVKHQKHKKEDIQTIVHTNKSDAFNLTGNHIVAQNDSSFFFVFELRKYSQIILIPIDIVTEIQVVQEEMPNNDSVTEMDVDQSTLWYIYAKNYPENTLGESHKEAVTAFIERQISKSIDNPKSPYAPCLKILEGQQSL